MSTISSDTALGMPGTSLADMTGDDPIVWGLRRTVWIKIGIIAVLFAAVFWPNLRRLWLKTNPINGEGNWSHSLFVPLIGLYYLFVHREQLLQTPARTAWSGLAVIGAGLLISMLSIWPIRNDFIWDFGMVVVLFGTVLLLCGWGVMRIAWFPLVFLLCAIPWPGLIYSQVASPLQELAAKVAVKVLQWTGVEAAVSGTKIMMALPPVPGRPASESIRMLNVAEACAGMRSLMTFIALGGAIAFLSARPLWQKFIIMASAVPIAIFCNVMRVSGQGLIDYYVTQKLSEGFAHAFVGMVMLIPAFFLLLLVGWVLDHLFIEEVDEASRRKAAAAKSAKIIIPQRAAAVAAVAAPAPVAPIAKPAAAAAPAAAKQPAAKAVVAIKPAAAVKPVADKPAAVAAPAPAVAKPAVRPAVMPPRPAGAPAMKMPPRPGTAGLAPRPAPVRKPPEASQPADASMSHPTTTPDDLRRPQP